MKEPTLYIVGDSTVCAFADDYYLPRCGYGTQLSRYLREGVKVVNLALSGRSSKSFLTEENYSLLTAGLSNGDFLVIAFGHNDEKREAERYTNPNTPYTLEDCTRGLSFKYNLYKNYICLARDRGATPILCTPIVRLSQEDDYSGTCGHITQTSGVFDGGDYPAAIRKLGNDVGVTVIDLTALSMARYKRLGHERAADFHAWAATSGGVRTGLDGTHLNKYGAAWAAYEWAVALSLSDDPLKNYLVPQLLPPREAELEQAVNVGYNEPEYEPFTSQKGQKLFFKLPSPWYATVMGNFGGVEHIAEFTVGGDGESIVVGNMSVVPRGGITPAADGFAAAFMPLAADDNFTFSAVCEVVNTDVLTEGERAFGVMLRDDIYCDSYVPALNSNYVAAGSAGKFGTGMFSRERGAITVVDGGKTAETDRYHITISRVNQQIKVSLGGSSRYWYDFDLSAVDGGSDYLCLFAANGVLVRFSEISFELTGKSVRA